jgi:hypothetical protein
LSTHPLRDLSSNRGETESQWLDTDELEVVRALIEAGVPSQGAGNDTMSCSMEFVEHHEEVKTSEARVARLSGRHAFDKTELD